MKLLFIATAGLVATSIVVVSVEAQTGSHAPQDRLRDSAPVWQLFAPDSATTLFGRDSLMLPALGRVAVMKRAAAPAATICPMPVAAVGASHHDDMPIGRADTRWVDRLPIARNSCTNPLATTPRP